jgi:hypothetical protein
VSGVRPTGRDHAVGAVLASAYVAVLLATVSDLGLSRDESFYVDAANAYAGWVEQLFDDPGAAFRREATDRAFTVNHEHPALPKVLFGLAHLADERLGIFTRPSHAYRAVGMLCAGLLVWLVYVFGVRLHGRRAGLFAALAYALLPRPFYHAHLAAFDVPIVLAMTATTYAYLRALSEPRWAWWTGILFGLALSTKHNSWFLPFIFVTHFACVAWLERRRRRRRAGAHPRLRLLPWWLFAMTVLGPLTFVGLWPWLWHDTLARVNSYGGFHTNHDYYNIAYFGVNYFWPPFPISYPWVMTLYTVPATTVVLGIAGIALWARAWLSRARALLSCGDDASGATDAMAASAASGAPAAVEADLLAFGSLLAPLVVVSLPSTPIFGGTKHWFTAYPFLALFAGLAFARAVDVLGAMWAARRDRDAERHPRWLAPATGALLLAPALVETAHAHPFGLSHYGFAAGFVPGAADRGMNRQFWGFTTGSLTGYFARALPNGGRVYVCDTTPGAFRMLTRDGLLPAGIVPTLDVATADLAIVHHEHHFAEVDHQIWTTWGTTRPDYVLSYDGVPIVSVYRNPRK